MTARRVAAGFLLIAVGALVGAGFVVRDVRADRPLETRLREDGQVVAATVVEITNSGQYGIAREVRVRLPDGRLTDVDLTDRQSNGAVREGATLHLLVDPADPAINRPSDAAPLGERWWPSASPLIFTAAAALLLTLIVSRKAR
jgi:ribosomal protein S28E/S33